MIQIIQIIKKIIQIQLINSIKLNNNKESTELQAIDSNEWIQSNELKEIK